MNTDTPSTDEIQRVGRYWQRVKALVCKHPEVVFDHDGMRCSECDRPLRMLSDIQIEELRRRSDG